eukprot:gene22300-biopygen23029
MWPHTELKGVDRCGDNAAHVAAHSAEGYGPCLVWVPALSYLHDVVGECNATLAALEDGDLSYDELQKRFHAVTNSWFEWDNEQWGPFPVDRFASEISAQLPRYYAAWKDLRCEGVDSLAYEWRGEQNWVNPPWALLDEVAPRLREEGAAATVVFPYWPGQSWFRELEALATEELNEDGKAHVLYDDGDEKILDLFEENFKIICSSSVSELTDGTADVNGENIDCGGDCKENKRGDAVENFLTYSLCER